MKKVTKAVIAAAGLNSRMYPFTKVESKLFIPVVNKPIVEWIVEELAASGIKEVIIVSNHTAKIKEFFKENESLNKLLHKMKKDNLIKKLHHVETLADIKLLRQEEPMGWMHEVYHARHLLKDEPFIVCFSDVLFTSEKPVAKQLIDVYRKTGKNIRGEGRFLLKPKVFDMLESEEFNLGEDLVDLDVFDKLREEDDLYNLNTVGGFHDVGDPLAYLKTQTIFGIKDEEYGRDYEGFLYELFLEKGIKGKNKHIPLRDFMCGSHNKVNLHLEAKYLELLWRLIYKEHGDHPSTARTFIKKRYKKVK